MTPDRAGGRTGLGVALAVALLALAGCSGVQTLSFPDPPPTTAHASSSVVTLPGNLSSVSEPAVPGATTTVPVITGPGGAALNGTVLGPNGAVPGATVEADRIVGNGVATVKTTTAADGSWIIPHILGGRYRVRAWQSPSLDLTTPQILFLASGQTTSLTLQLAAYSGPSVAPAMTPSSPEIGELANLLVQVTNPTVGADGVLRNPPDTGVSVTLTGASGWQVYNGNPQSTDAEGQVLFEISCTAAGSDPLGAEIGSSPPTSLLAPVCTPPPTTTSSTTSTTTTTLPCPSTSTTTATLPFGTSAPTATTSVPAGC